MENLNDKKTITAELDEVNTAASEHTIKNEKIKWVTVGIGIGVLVTAILSIAFFLLNQTKINQFVQQNKPVQEKVTTNKPASVENQEMQEEKNEIEADWSINLSNQETTSEKSLTKNTLLYATKENYKVVVFQRDIRNGNQKKVFEYDEDIKAEKSGDFGEGLPPNIALSPDETNLVFIDREGLKNYNLQSGSTRTLINKISEVNPTTVTQPKSAIERLYALTPPKWSIEDLYAFNLSSPKWSADGRYISFLKSQYESQSFGVLDVLSGEYIPLDSLGGDINLTWGPNGDSFIKPSSDAYQGRGLFFASPNFEKIENLSEKFEKKSDSFFEANFSPNGGKIVFTYMENLQSEDVTIGIVNTDGSQFLAIDKGDIQLPLFSGDDDSVLFIKKVDDEQHLFRYDMTNEKIATIALLPKTFNRWKGTEWTKDGFLVITGISSSSRLVRGGDSSRLIILDLDNSKVVYASPVYNQFVTFAGLIK